MSNHIAVAYADVFEEMVTLSPELGFKVRILGARGSVLRAEPSAGRWFDAQMRR